MAQQPDLIPAETIKGQLVHTWAPFFARYGNFTLVQQQAILPLLAGQNTLIIAATASGKTEAAIAPLLELHCLRDRRPGKIQPALQILYICPTRALVRDLYERLRLPLESLNIALAMKSGDTGPVSTTRPPTVLITTPESTDSLLTRTPRLFIPLRALVIDEIHLFDNSPRGDHLRCLLRRIETIQRYAQQQGVANRASFQRVALSATVPDPVGITTRYLVETPMPCQSGPQTIDSEQAAPVAPPPTIVAVAGGRRLLAKLAPMAGLADLVTALALRNTGQSQIRKSLLFCNTRNEVEQVAAYLRRHLPYEAAIFVHYSNLDPALRRAVESGFAEASVAICVSSSTLELGIDIGSIDDVVLIGPPPTTGSFLQRIGRGGRRGGMTQTLCLARSPLEEVRFQALLTLVQSEGGVMAHARLYAPTYHFRPSVLVQQVFSLLKQSPTGSVRLADLRRIAPAEISDEDLRRLLRHLVVVGYVRTGRPGEWRAGTALDPLLEEHEIYSNIGADPLATVIVDAYSGRTIAQTGQHHFEGDKLLMGGRIMEVVWRDRYKIGVRASTPDPLQEELRFQTAPFAVPLEVSQAVARHWQVAPGQLCLLPGTEGAWLFHFWGDLYGALLAGILQAMRQQDDEGEVEATPITVQNEHCLRLPFVLTQLPPWNDAVVQRQLRILLPRLEPLLEVGRFHSLLPVELAEQAILAQCDLPRFKQLYQTATLVAPAPKLRMRLLDLTH